jgi:pimeloyl-ACP methyl ester carboxylesterase
MRLSKRRVTNTLGGTIITALRAAVLALFCTGCVCRLSIPASACVQQNAEGPLAGGMPRLCLVNSVTPRPSAALIIYATSDSGWSGTGKALFRHLAERGYPLVGISSPNYLKDVERETKFITPDRLAKDLASIIDTAKRDLNLPAATPTILVGISRGAGFMVVAAAQHALQPRPAGAVALALTRETDYVRHHLLWRKRSASRAASTMADGRVLTYARLKSAFDIPIAVIQSTHDRYLPAAEARALFGPDTGTRRFLTVEARSHGFRGARDAVFRELDNALDWIESGMPQGGAPATAPASPRP